MNLAQHAQVFVRLPSAENNVQPYHAGIVTAVWPDESGNLDPTAATVLCSIYVLPMLAGDQPRCITVRVYDIESNAGNAAVDAAGYAFVNRDQEQESKPPQVELRGG